ncbi:hypothetical protein Hanom_Chr01g00041471 [Helianthus anomalus]
MSFNAGVRVFRDPNWLRKRPILLMSIFLCSGYSPVVRLDSNPLKCLNKLLSVVNNIFSDTTYSAKCQEYFLMFWHFIS